MVSLCDPEQLWNCTNSGCIYGREPSIVGDCISIYRIQINYAPDPINAGSLGSSVLLSNTVANAPKLPIMLLDTRDE